MHMRYVLDKSVTVPNWCRGVTFPLFLPSLATEIQLSGIKISQTTVKRSKMETEKYGVVPLLK
jgi:hypothetical protein